ncbi:MAG: DUF2062 domain-containing protein [Nitrospirae bacterium]|nr:DUF2062 domain-containing protein [Nitrospirota bacterium]MBI3595346.1 DUF2062 domain-containing protein [Nitrospirota bacterium]
MIAKVKIKIKELLHLNDSPRKIALAFAVGVFIAFSPILGFHTIMVLLSAWLFRLNPVALFAGAFVNNPWTFAPLYGLCLWFGIYLYGGSAVLPQVSWEHLTLLRFIENLKPYIGPFFLGTTIIGLIVAFLSYILSYIVINRIKESKKIEI